MMDYEAIKDCGIASTKVQENPSEGKSVGE